MIYLAENLRMFRKPLGLPQEDEAEAVFVAPQSVSKRERGKPLLTSSCCPRASS